jgi:hypothetical protein
MQGIRKDTAPKSESEAKPAAPSQGEGPPARPSGKKG